jgi:adenine deaminase
VAGAHGRNAEEFIDRVRDCGVDPMPAMVSANPLGAEGLGLGDQIGSIAPGFQAGIIALDGGPVERHHCRSTRCVCNEGRSGLQERCARRDPSACRRPALIRPLRVGLAWLTIDNYYLILL